MKTVARVLLNVFVKRFYIINAGFFLFLFFLFFGIIHGGQLITYHKSLILSIITSPVVMAMVCVAWLLYNFKCIAFSTVAINAADGSYIYVLKGLPFLKQVKMYLLISALQYMPVLAYSFFVVYMAFATKAPLAGILVIIYQMIMLSAGAWIIFNTINKNNLSTRLEKIIAKISGRSLVRLGYYGFLPTHIFHSRKISFLIVKIFSILLLSVSFIRNGDQFDADLFGIFFQLILVAHSLLVFYCVDFSETQLQFSRNLPVGLYKVAGMYLFTYCGILLPETAFMLVNNNGNLPVTEIIVLYFTAVSMLYFYTSIMYGCGLNMESYMLMVFVLFLINFFLQKTGLQLLSLLGILLAATTVFRSTYYSFERE